MLKRKVIIGIILLLFLVIIVSAVIFSRQQSKNTDDNMLVFRNSLFTIRYPDDYELASSNPTSVEFKPIGNSTEDTQDSSSSIAISRMGPRESIPNPETLLSTLKENGGSQQLAEFKNKPTIITNVSSDEETEITYIIYDAVHVWSITFVHTDPTRLEQIVDTVVNSFSTSDSYITDTLLRAPASDSNTDNEDSR